MVPNRRLLAPAVLLPALAVAAQVVLAPPRAPSAPPVAHAQQPPTRYLDPIFTRTERTNDIVYGTAIDKPTGRPVDLKLDVYEPTGDTAAARPVFIFLFGGGFVAGTKDLEPTVYCEQMARRGYVAIAPSYRLNQGNVWFDGIPAAVADARQAVRWVRSNAEKYRLDTERIIIGGSSAGAITSLFVAYTDMERAPGSGAGGEAPSDETDGSEVALVMDLWGGLYSEVNQLGAGEPPLAIVHGTADDVVPYTEATALRDRAEAQGVPYVFHPLEGKGHAPYMPIELMTTLAPFFYEHLWPSGADGGMPDLSGSDRIGVTYGFLTAGRTDDASIEIRQMGDGWHGTAAFSVKGWGPSPRTRETTVPITVSNEAMGTFLAILADTPLSDALPQPTATAAPDLYATFAFDLAAGDKGIVGFTSGIWSPVRRHSRPYSIAIGDERWMTDGDEPDRALDAIYDALRFDELDRLIRDFNTWSTAVPSASPTATATRSPSPPTAPPRTRIWLPVAQR